MLVYVVWNQNQNQNHLLQKKYTHKLNTTIYVICMQALVSTSFMGTTQK